MFQLFQRPTCPLLRDSSDVAWIKGERVVFIIRIEGAEYIYEWGFDKKKCFLLNNAELKSTKFE